ncbi:hypothetical protein [Rhizobium sp.]|uniref:hypothetical protein n=1 Tax=Rhizobium sp. TaxID=391 RepID=UPI0028A8DD4A
MLSPYADADQSRNQDLRSTLYEWTKHFTNDTDLGKQIVEATILNLLEEPEQIDGANVRKSLFAAVSRAAKAAISSSDWRAGPLDIEVYPERDGFVVVLRNGEQSERKRFINERLAVSYAKTLHRRTLTIGGKVIPLRRRYAGDVT